MHERILHLTKYSPYSNKVANAFSTVLLIDFFFFFYHLNRNETLENWFY